MKIKNLKNQEIEKNPGINKNFFNVKSENLDLSCKFYKGSFYLDSFYFFPITNEYFSFSNLYGWKESKKHQHFFENDFSSNFIANKDKFKIIENAVILGLSAANNYYRNLISFLPRIFFVLNKEVNIVIHRNSSNKVRDFIKQILSNKGIKLKRFIYLDDDFYFFRNCEIPQFFSEQDSIKILNKISLENTNKKNRLYLTRKNCEYRKLINESEIVEYLKSKNFKIIDTDNLSINEQIDFFSSAEIVIGPTGSALTNIVFCKKNTKIFEITPDYKYNFEIQFQKRFSNICKILGLQYTALTAEPVENHLKKNIKFINKETAEKSNYYKNLLIREKKIKELNFNSL